ncbi:MAG: hypothetical protein Q4F80_07385 [bacterium]|nr:hypothetical protein [bacterium]
MSAEKFSYMCLIAALIIIIIMAGNKPDILKSQKDKARTSIFAKIKPEEEINKRLKEITAIKFIPINPVSDYNYLKKSEIYQIRKACVKDSLFASKNYKPADEVFGNIEDNKPWYGLKYYNCAANQDIRGSKDITEGDSEESRFINNPSQLVGINCGGFQTSNYKSDPICTAKIFHNIPTLSKYHPDTNTIVTSYVVKNGHSCMLTGINARDLGYKYVYAENYKNIEFLYPENISNKIYEFKDYLHTGSSCGIEGGCTNGSPRQDELAIAYDGIEPAEINLRLWRKLPKSALTKEDINFKLLFYPQ